LPNGSAWDEFVALSRKEGYATSQRSISGGLFRFGGEGMQTPEVRVVIRLVESQKMPARMTYVPGGNYRLESAASGHGRFP